MFRHCDVTQSEKHNTFRDKDTVIIKVNDRLRSSSCTHLLQCVEFHPWLRYYSEDWLVKVIMQQTLAKTSHKYKFKEWGDEKLVQKMSRGEEEREEEEEEEDEDEDEDEDEVEVS